MVDRRIEPEGTHFLNVDLDIFSKVPLDPIVDAFGEKVFVLYAGRRGRRFSAYFELGGYWKNPQADRLISGLVRLVNQLPKASKRLWYEADAREFNIGIEAAQKSEPFELRLQPETVAAVGGVRGRIVVTVYAPQRVLRSSRKQRRQLGPAKRRLQSSKGRRTAAQKRRGANAPSRLKRRR